MTFPWPNLWAMLAGLATALIAPAIGIKGVTIWILVFAIAIAVYQLTIYIQRRMRP